MAIPPQMLAANAEAPAAEPARKKQRKKPAAVTPMSITLLREAGWFADKVEQRLPIPGAFVTRDVFGFGDILAVNENLGILLVQTTTGDNSAARQKKIVETPEILKVAKAWLKIGGLIEIHAWAKRGLRGERKVWTCRTVSAGLVGDTLTWTELGSMRKVSHEPAHVPDVR